MNQEQEPAYGLMKKKALEQLRSGKSLYRQGWCFCASAEKLSRHQGSTAGQGSRWIIIHSQLDYKDSQFGYIGDVIIADFSTFCLPAPTHQLTKLISICSANVHSEVGSPPRSYVLNFS